MTPQDWLDELLWRFSSPEDGADILGVDDLARWPKAAFGELSRLALVDEHTPANRIACPSCESGHVEEVQFSEDAQRLMHAVIRCTTNGRVEVEIRALQQWRLRGEALARFLREAIGAQGDLHEKVRNRAWSLGFVDTGDERREVLLDLHGTPEWRAHALAGQAEICLVAALVQADSRALCLRDVLGWDGDTLTVDRERVVSSCRVTPRREIEPAGYMFQRDATGWVLAFGARPFHLGDLLGLAAVHSLLEQPNCSILAVDMVGGTVTEAGLDLVDRNAIRTLRAVLAKGGAGADAAAITRYLAQNTGRSGRPRKGPSPFSRAADVMRNRIDRALDRVETQDPAMALHLRQSITTGVALTYQTPADLGWSL